METWDLPTEQADHIGQALAASRPKGEVFAELVTTWSLPASSNEIWASYRTRMPELVTRAEADRAGLERLRAAG